VRSPKLKPKVWGQDLIEQIQIRRSAIHQAHESENSFLVSVQVRSIRVVCQHFSFLKKAENFSTAGLLERLRLRQQGIVIL
jgi:hypothetical protein